MNLFLSERSPAILAILVAVVGFYVSTVVGQIRSEAAITYRFTTYPDGRAVLRLENVSLSKLVESAVFEINCRTLVPDCLAPLDPNAPAPRFAAIGRTPPVSPANAEVSGDPTFARLRATLVPGAVVTMTVRSAAPARMTENPLEFYYTAARDAPEAILLLDATRLTARFVDNYLDFMVLVFVLASLGLVLVILGPPFWRAVNPRDPNAPEPGQEKPE